MTGIKDVAREANVSVATVSRVINKSGTVTKQTEELVMQTIERLGYKPNLFGKNLRGSETKIIMILLSSLANTFCSRVIGAIDKIANENGYYVMICTTDGDRQKEEHYINFACNGLFDGIIILNSMLTNEATVALSKKIPVVQCNEFTDTVYTPYVSINNELAAYDAVSLLIKNGRRNIVFYTVKNELLSTRERLSGYKRALAENSIQFDENLVVYGNYGYRNAIMEFDKFLSKKREFEGVFAVSDRMAAGVVNVLSEKGIDVPGAVEVIGFDNTDISYTSTPKLTTVAQPHSELGRNAFELVLKLIRKEKTESIILPHKIIRRDSTQ